MVENDISYYYCLKKLIKCKELSSIFSPTFCFSPAWFFFPFFASSFFIPYVSCFLLFIVPMCFISSSWPFTIISSSVLVRPIITISSPLLHFLSINSCQWSKGETATIGTSPEPLIPASSEANSGVYLKLDPWVLKTPR